MEKPLVNKIKIFGVSEYETLTDLEKAVNDFAAHIFDLTGTYANIVICSEFITVIYYSN
jgi:hypothetical protein